MNKPNSPAKLECDNKQTSDDSTPSETASLNFIEKVIAEHADSGRFDSRVHTRFPPEPNGYLHVGHAKSICLNFGLAGKYEGGLCNLRFDDTNPAKEEDEFVQAIQADIRWLGFDWEDRLCFASDYFEQLYDWAVKLINEGQAYVCDLSPQETSEYRGRWNEPGRDSPFRNRTVEENLDLFTRMRAGEFADGARVLRAKIDMTAANINMRDPVMYRIMRAHHHRTGDAWCIYPTYDFTHGQSDAIEGVTHSICTLEFEDHRPLYDWYLDKLGVHHPQQIEFAKLALSHTITSKRKLLAMVNEGHVSGWDDPRMPTLAGMRRRGYTPAAIRAFCERIGVTKINGLISIGWLEDEVRKDLNRVAPRVMAVLDPLKVIITNYPEGKVEHLEAINNPEDAAAGVRQVPFSRELYIERNDFMEDPPKKFFRLGPGREVRLRYAYFIRCEEAIKDPETGEIVELRCTYDEATRGGSAPDGRKVKGTLHWVSAAQSLPAEVRQYQHLFTKENPSDLKEGEDFRDHINPDSLETLTACRVEPSLADASPGDCVQFERQGYFCIDTKDSRPDKLVFNRTVTLRDTWAKVQKKGGGKKKK